MTKPKEAQADSGQRESNNDNSKHKVLHLMKINVLFKCLKLQNRKNYQRFVENYDVEKLLANEPLCIKDKGLENKDLSSTSGVAVWGYTETHEKLAKKYGLYRIAVGETDFERAENVIKWLTANTFYNGAQITMLKDSGIDILDYSFGKSFLKAINCRNKAIAFADCLVSVGIKAYPVCMISSGFKEGCHFTCHVYLKEVNKWCAFDPSFGCWFTDKNGRFLDLFEIRDLFLADDEPVINGYSFNGTEKCKDIYLNAFLKLNLSNLSTWKDSSAEGRTGKKWKEKKKFEFKIPKA